MCGIAGLLDLKGSAQRTDAGALATAMALRIAHRGPDDAGCWTDDSGQLALAFRRLSIIDLSPTGSQPMHSDCGRYVLVSNGEIYNYRELRDELGTGEAAPRWKGTSDTEVLLAAISRWGIHAAMDRLVGMFAFALWDKRDRVLVLARDRMGEKPLYYGWAGHSFIFASELKALAAHPAWRPEIDRDVAALFLRLGYVPTPYSICKGFLKLPAGCLLRLPVAGAQPGSLPDPTAYWTVASAVAAGKHTPFTGSDAEAVERLEALLGHAVRGQMVSDVPLGAFLSGGIDSSTIVALMQAHSSRPVKTFAIGFHERAFDEAPRASEVARHLRTDHHELYVSAREALETVPSLPALYDEPFADSSQIPTYLISRLARSQVTVSLSGDGGDELFGGYNRYHWGQDLWRTFGWMPLGLRRVMSRLALAMPSALVETGYSVVRPVMPPRLRFEGVTEKLRKLASILSQPSQREMYHFLISLWQQPEHLVPGALTLPCPALDRPFDGAREHFPSWMMELDAGTYLPDDILVKLDRASMAVGLEARTPFLDHRIVEFAWSLPHSMKYRGNTSKWILREVLHRHVPKPLVERPKMGFAVPLDQWLRGPLRDWAESHLSRESLARMGLLEPKLVRKVWEEHLAGKGNWQHLIWRIVMLQAWCVHRADGDAMNPSCSGPSSSAISHTTSGPDTPGSA